MAAGVKRRGQTERHFRNRVNSMKGLAGCGQCLEMLLTERTMAQEGVKMPSKQLEPGDGDCQAW